MKVALVFPRTRYPVGDPPLGIAYLAAALREKLGEDPAIIDTTFIPDPMAHIEQELKKGKYDVVGISAMVTMAREAAATARMAKKARADSLVIVGGPHATTLPGDVLDEPAVDAVCIGEGELSFIEAVEKGSADGVAGIMVREGDEIKGKPREMIRDLDSVPFPALDLLPMDDYFSHWFQLDSIAPGIKGTSVLATRGCPFSCAYCQPTLDSLFGKVLRKRSPRNVVAELGLRKEQFGISGFLFSDDTFIADRRWVLSFCTELIESGLGLIWGCNVRADLVDAELLGKMHGAGLSKVYIGIEVYDDECRREVFLKKLTREQVEAAVGSARKLGISTQGYFMLGAPGESRADVWRTVRYAWGLPIDDAVFNLTTPLPGTYLYQNYSDKIAVDAVEMDYYQRYSFVSENGVSEGWLNRMQVISYTGFYLKPRRLIRQLKSLFSRGGAQRFFSKLRRVF